MKIRAEANKEPFNETVPDVSDITNPVTGCAQSDNDPMGEYHEYSELNNHTSVRSKNEVNSFQPSGGYVNLEDQENGENESVNEDKYQKYKTYYSYFGGWYETIKSKLNQTSLGENLIYYGSKTLEYLIFAGEKVLEKSSAGLQYLKRRINHNTRESVDVDVSGDNGGEALIDKNNVLDI